jgi:S1-C subfamily serine protease
MARKKKNYTLIIAAVVLIALGAYYFLYTGGYLAGATSLSLTADLTASACKGDLQLGAEIRNAEGERLPDTLIHLYAENEHLDSLYTDRNGQIHYRANLRQGWCGRRIGFLATYDGDISHLSANARANALIKAPTSLSIVVKGESLEGENATVVANLTKALTGSPLAGKNVTFDSVNVTTGTYGTASFTFSFNKTGSKSLSATYPGDKGFEGSQASASLEVLSLACSDGTLVNKCSGQYECTENRSLEFNCSKCSCPSNLLCISNECITDEARTGKLIKKLQKSIVQVESDETGGSGVILSSGNGTSIILTNRHVIDPNFSNNLVSDIEVLNYTNEIGKPARILVAPNQLDLALLIVNKEMGPAVNIDFNTSIERGDSVLALGSPLGIQNTVTKGIVSNFFDTESRANYTYEAIQIDAAVNPGNSGGGIFLARDGKLIGITTFKLLIAKAEPAEGLGFAVPIDLIEDFPTDGWNETYSS